MSEQFPVCPDCGERHDPNAHAGEEMNEKTAKKLHKAATKLMGIVKDIHPENALRLLIALLTAVTSTMNVQTRQNVVRILGKRLDLVVLFGMPAPSRAELENWKPQAVNPKDVN
jgi:hypothetical protein